MADDKLKSRSSRDTTKYIARLFRGWDLVTLRYELREEELLVREDHIWGWGSDKHVPFEDLSGEMSHVLARQPGLRLSLTIAIVAAMAIAMDLVAALMVPPGRPLWQPMWIAAGVALLVAAVIFLAVRKQKLWTHVKPKSGRKGAFILHDPRNKAGHETFVRVLKRRLETWG